MLTMVSIDATGELNEELSRSLSLAKEILQVKLACEMLEVGEICGRPVPRVVDGAKRFHPRSRDPTIQLGDGSIPTVQGLG